MRSLPPIKHAAWPTGVPPVCTVNWDQESWDKFAEGWRPAWYAGDAHDFAAYEEAKALRVSSQAHTAGEP